MPSVDAWREVLATNLFGAFYMTKAVTWPMLRARGGRIVNITPARSLPSMAAW